VHLDAVTRRDAAADFFGEEFVPKEAITMGVATILDAREIAILATGEHKASIVRRAVEGDIHHEVAATFLQRHREHDVLRRPGRGRRPDSASPPRGCSTRFSGRRT
jgi:6-phosphogluconolactonase/glucosamine-6-phosphate isomerase/deaminase